MPPKAHAHPPATVPAEPVVLSDNDRAKEVKKYYEQAPNDARIAHAILVKRFACNSQAAGRRAASREYAPRHVEQQAKRPFIVALRPVRNALEWMKRNAACDLPPHAQLRLGAHGR